MKKIPFKWLALSYGYPEILKIPLVLLCKRITTLSYSICVIHMQLLQVSEEFALELLEVQSHLKFDWKQPVPKLIHQVTHSCFLKASVTPWLLAESLSLSLSLGCEPLLKAPYDMAPGLLPWEQAREQAKSSKQKPQSFYNLLLKGASYNFCHILFTRMSH